MSSCSLCHRLCRIDRANGKTGFCGQTSLLRGARAALHFWEEPCISGKTGSGAVFFSGCSLGCVFCQNREIALGKQGLEISPDKLSGIFLTLQEEGAVNINLVTPTHFVPQIIYSLEQSKKMGLSIPIVYNTGTYETMDTLRMLEGLVDIYLPDLKYYAPEVSRRYAGVDDYFEKASENIREMVRQVGAPVFADEKGNLLKGDPADVSETGLMKKGVIVRHLLLPGQTEDSLKILDHLHSAYGNRIFVSLMNQYTPLGQHTLPELNRKLTKEEYDRVIDRAIELNMEQVFIQDGDVAEESFIPEFDFTGIL